MMAGRKPEIGKGSGSSACRAAQPSGRRMASLLLFFALFCLCTGAPLSDEDILLQMKEKGTIKAPDLVHWKKDGLMCTGWTNRCGDPCDFRLQCNYDNKSLTSLTLMGAAVSGFFAEDFGKLRSLQEIELQATSIVGPIDRSFRRLTSLLVLTLTNNTSLNTTLASLLRNSPPNIEEVKLIGNGLQGIIPPFIGNFTSIRTLDLGYNDLIGELPPTMVALKDLVYLSVAQNKINGTIPRWLGNLTSLTELYLQENFLEGPIPPEVAMLPYLGAMEAYSQKGNKKLTGPLPAKWGPTWNRLILSDNLIDGPIPPALGGMCVDQCTLDLSKNSLNGTVPASFVNWTTAPCELNLDENYLMGPLPPAFDKTAWSSILDKNCLDMSAFKCKARYAPPSPPPTPPSPPPSVSPAPPAAPGVPSAPSRAPSSSPSSKGSRPILILGVAAGALTVLILATAALLVCCRKRLRKRVMRRFLKKKSKSKWADFSDMSGFELEGNILFTLKSIKAMTDDFAPENFLGQGGFGQVYRGALPGGKLVAVKRLMFASKRAEEEFKNEAFVINRVRHKNLVALRGFCAEQGERILVMDYMKGGGLDTALFKVEDKRLDWTTRKRIILGAARALAYLHHDGPVPIIHRDIKAANVLLDEYMDAHVADFGLARLLPKDETHVSTAVGGTFGYLPPEYVFKQQLSIKVDVYSFGILLLELLAGRQNISPQQEENVVLLFEEVWHAYLQQESILENIVDPRIRSQMSEAEALQWAKVGLSCIQSNPADRPTMVKVVALLEEYTSTGVDSMRSQDPFDPMSSSTSSRSEISRSIRHPISGIGRNGWGGASGSSGSTNETYSTTNSLSIPSKSISEEGPESPSAWPSRSSDMYDTENDRGGARYSM